MTRILKLAAASTVALALFSAPRPTTAQWLVFDPNNYVQNVLTAARELEQINNQVLSLQNEAQMLINQAKNLANLPYSAAATDRAIDPADTTASRAGAAHRLRRATGRPSLCHDLCAGVIKPIRSGAHHECTNTMAERDRRASGRIASSGNRRRQSRYQPNANLSARECEPGRNRRPAGKPGWQSASWVADPAARRPHGNGCGAGQGAEPRTGTARRCSRPGQGAAQTLSDAGLRLSALNRADVSLMMRDILFRRLPACRGDRFHDADGCGLCGSA